MFDHPLALELAYIAVEESIRLGASYADARYELRRNETVLVRNGRLVHVTTGFERGLGVRVLVKGSWGYVGISEPNRHDVTVAAKKAVAAGRAAAILQDHPVELVPQTPERGLFRTKIRRDPLAVPVEDKLALLMAIDEQLRAVSGVIVTEGHIRAQSQRKVFVSSEGSELDQDLMTTGVGYRAGATDGTDLHMRSFPGGPQGMVRSQGWELVAGLPLLDQARQVAEEAVALSKADPCPNDVSAVILTASQMAHHLNATTAHLFELDRVLGMAPAGAGGSFLGIDKLGSFAFGPQILNIVADARETGGAGSFGFDDEGAPAQRVDLVTQGRFAGLLCGRETAQRVGLEGSYGCVRASHWAQPPTVRATNVSMAPGDAGSLDDLIKDTEQGILLDGPRSFSVDGSGRTFTASAEAGWEIKDGVRGRMLKNPLYQGSTTDFWHACDAICSESEWAMYGTFGRPKGRAAQCVPMGVGAAAARFSRVEVGAHHRRPSQVPDGATVTVLDSGTDDAGAARKNKVRRAKKKSKKRVRKKDTK